jgi:Cytidine and deoxycytidylate deaminase zinc-binding region
MNLRPQVDTFSIDMTMVQKYLLSRYLALATHQAQKSDIRATHGCVAIGCTGRRVMATGYNYRFKERINTKTRTICSVHAEVAAYYKIPKRHRHRIILLVIRVMASGSMGISKPCKSCEKFIARKKLKVLHSTPEGRIVHFGQI